MVEAELEALLDDIESDLVERKSSLHDRDRIRQAVCAYANDLPAHGKPGLVFVGADDDGKPSGLAITDELLRTLSEIRFDGQILPPPSLIVQKLTLKGSPMAVVQVHPSDSPPVRYKGQVWIRVGPRRGIATIEEERRLTERRIAGQRTFDMRPCREASLDDLLLAEFKDVYLPQAVDRAVIAENRRSIEDQLGSLRFFDLRSSAPTNAGIILFGRDPLSYLPGAYVQFARFDGDSLADPVQDQKAVNGNLVTQLRLLDELLPVQIHVTREAREGLRHQDQPDYPLIAVREIVLNAIIHRSYEGTNAPVRINWFRDRVEIQNPGGLYGQVTPENFERTSDYRNPALAEALKTLGYVERFGTGITRAKRAMAGNGNPLAEFRFEPEYVLVVIRSR